MTFLIRPYDSFTSRLREAISTSTTWPAPASLRVLVEGPYGHTQPLDSFERALFLVGGSGIVVPLAYLEKLLVESKCTKSVHIVWAVRELAFAEDVLRRDLGSLATADKLSMDICVTHNDGATDLDGLADLPKTARLRYGRPYVRECVEEEVKASGEDGSLAVVACGPARMADDARSAVVDALGWEGSTSRIAYFEESFKW